MTTRAEAAALDCLVAAARKVDAWDPGGHQPKCWLPGGRRTKSGGTQDDTSRTRLVCRCGLTDLREALADYDALLAVARGAPETSRAPGP